MYSAISRQIKIKKTTTTTPHGLPWPPTPRAIAPLAQSHVISQTVNFPI